MSESKVCKNCQNKFEIAEEDTSFYQKIQVPEPTHCSDCRRQRRLAFRNERNLFKRKCDLCQKEIISFFPEQTAFPVYCSPCWLSDRWDPLSYGQDFDFSKPFFEQFHALMNKVPKMAVLNLNNENSDYNTFVAFSKNTYMSPGSYHMEDSYYCCKSQYCKDSLNSNFLDHCELTSNSTNCRNCYRSHYLINCRNCHSCQYMAHSTSCQDCFMCINLSNKKFHYKNKPYSEEEYKKIVIEQSKRPAEELEKEFEEFSRNFPKKYQNQLNCENSSGDYLQNCKNTIDCYDCFDVQDSKYLAESVTVKDSMDLTMHDKNIELCYEICSGGESNYNVKFAFCPCASQNSEYIFSCFYLGDSFGCDGIHMRQSNCILNKKYGEAEYKELRLKIIDHMKKTGEYGDFFPISISPHAYNNTMAYDYFPMSREEAMKKGYIWQEKNTKNYQPPTVQLPNSIYEISDAIVKEILACKKCGKNYRVILQELALSRKMGQALSPYCSDCRQLRLLNLKNPRRLYARKCDKCNAPIQTTYAPEKPEKVFCEACYLKEVY